MKTLKIIILPFLIVLFYSSTICIAADKSSSAKQAPRIEKSQQNLNVKSLPKKELTNTRPKLNSKRLPKALPLLKANPSLLGSQREGLQAAAKEAAKARANEVRILDAVFTSDNSRSRRVVGERFTVSVKVFNPAPYPQQVLPYIYDVVTGSDPLVGRSVETIAAGETKYIVVYIGWFYDQDDYRTRFEQYGVCAPSATTRIGSELCAFEFRFSSKSSNNGGSLRFTNNTFNKRLILPKYN